MNGDGMKKTSGLLLVAVLALSAFAAAPSALAQTSSGASEEATQTITTVVDSLIQIENGYIVRRPDNGGRALKILDAMSFSEAKLRRLEQAQQLRTPIQLVIKGTTIVDIR
jgi:Spy/CpxP family protein refolding chaperone